MRRKATSMCALKMVYRLVWVTKKKTISLPWRRRAHHRKPPIWPLLVSLVNLAWVLPPFHRHGLDCRMAAHTLRLTPEQRINRIAFCEVMLEQWDENGLDSIVFTDEKMFCTDVERRSKVWRPWNTRYHPEYLKEQDRSGRLSNMYWSAIGAEGPLTYIVQI